MDFFEIFAECSIALAGFGAIHAVLRGATGPRGALRAWTVVVQGALSFILSVLPLILAFTALPNGILWRTASALGVAGAGATAYSFIALDRRMTRIGHPPQAVISIRTAQLFSVSAILAMFVNLIGWPWPSGPFLYAVALVLIVGTGLTALLHSFLLPILLVLKGKGVGFELPQEPNSVMKNAGSEKSGEN